MFRRNRRSIEFRQVSLILALVVNGASYLYAVAIPAAVAVMMLVGMGQARGATTAGNFSGEETVIDFGSWPTPYTIPEPYVYADSGVNFSLGGGLGPQHLHLANKSTYFDNIPGASLEGALLATLVTPPINIDFGDTPVNRAGMLVSARDPISTFRLTAFDAGGSVLKVVEGTQPELHKAVFLGLESPRKIASMELKRIESARWAYSNMVDDVRFEFDPTIVPEPSTLVLLGMGALGLLLCYLRQRK